MKKSVVLYQEIHRDLVEYLEKYANVHYFNGINPSNYNDVLKALENADGLLGVGGAINESLLKNAKNLKVVSTISVGYDHCDINYLDSRKIILMHTPDVLTETTADTIFTLILSTARRAMELNQMVKSGAWINAIGMKHYGWDVHHKTIGIVGMGRIGQAVAKRAHCGFGMQVLYTANSPKPHAEDKYNAKGVNLDELLTTVDFVCLTVPYTPATDKLINAEKLALMKPSAILINGARGRVVDEKALIDALKNKVICAAGLDVFEGEPLGSGSPLLEMDNVVTLPHIGSATHETRYAMAKCAIDNLIAAFEGKATAANIVNPQAL